MSDYERVKRWREKQRERKAILKSKGLKEISIIVTEEQARKIEHLGNIIRDSDRHPKMNMPDLLYRNTQPGICAICETYDRIVKRHHQAALEAEGLLVDLDRMTVVTAPDGHFTVDIAPETKNEGDDDVHS
jgi:hypothetical protein